MSSLKNLPVEITKHIFLALDNPSDLLHVALTCKYFYEMIVPTHHLDLTSIICHDSTTPLEFWQILCASPHHASMIRQLQFYDQSVPNHLSVQQQFRGRRIDKEFVIGLGSADSPPPCISAAFNPQEFFLKSLIYMGGLKSVSIFKEHSFGLYDCIHHLSKYFSNSLEDLHIVPYDITFNDPTPQYKLSDLNFHCLTSFSLTAYTPVQPSEPLGLLLNSLATSNHTLVNFALAWFDGSISVIPLVKKATWPTLKKLTLVGNFRWIDHDTSREETINLFLSFFARHSQLERLCVSVISEDEREFSDELGLRLPSLLPSLRSLQYKCPIPLNTLCRLEHVTMLSVPAGPFLVAQSLRSCSISSLDYGNLQHIVKAMPQQLERFSVTFWSRFESPGCFESFVEELPKAVSPLTNLTHLDIRFNKCLEYADCSPEGFINYLPSLTYFRFSNICSGEWMHVMIDDSSFPHTCQFHSLKGGPDQSYKTEFWGDFFQGPIV